jgi:predicted RND superfamily exporter protein
VKSPRFLQNKLAALGRWVSRRPGRALLAMLLVTLAAAPVAAYTLLNVQQDLLEVLSRGMPRAEAFKQIGRDFGIIDRHFVAIELRSRDDLEDGKKLADRVAELLATEETLVRSARSHMDLKKFFLEYAYVYYAELGDELGDELARKFSDASLEKAMRTNRELLSVQSGNRELILRDPLQLRDLAPRIQRRLARRLGAEGSIDPEAGGYFVSQDIRREDGSVGKMLLVDVRPVTSSADQKFGRRLMAHTRRCVAQARREVFGLDRSDLSDGSDTSDVGSGLLAQRVTPCGETAVGGRISTEIAGAYAMSQHMTGLIGRGVLLGAAVSFLLIVSVFVLAYRRPAAFFFIGVPLAVPVVWTLALSQVPLRLFGYEGRASMIGLAFCAVLLGLGVDYAIHIYNRYVSERNDGADPEAAAGVSLGATGEGIVIGAITTVVAFLGMTLTNFRGFKEFGAMAGLGVFLTMVALLVCMPAALTLISRLKGERERARPPLSFGLERALRLVRARPGLIVTLGLGLLVLSVVAMFVDPAQMGVNFESDMGKMGPPKHLDTVGELNKRIARNFKVDYKQISAIVRGPDAEKVMERTAELIARARRIERVRSARGLTDLVPAPSRQRQSLTRAKSKLLPGLKDLSARMGRAAKAAGLNPKGLERSQHYRRFVETMEQMAVRIASGRMLDVEKLPDETVAELAGFMFRAPEESGGDYRTHTMISLDGYEGLESRHYQELAAELGVNDKNVTMTSYVLIIYELKDSVQGDLLLCTALVAGIVLIMLLVALRRPVFVLLALSPVVMGAAFLLVVMKVTSRILGAAGSEAALDLNYINVLVFPVLIGIGVDNAVHLIIRARQDGLEVAGAVTETGRALVLCSLTTMLGFLSLTTCPHWGIRSLGIVVAIGMGFVMLVSVLFVPAVLELLRRRATVKPAEGG